MNSNVFVLLRNFGNDWPEIMGIFISRKRAEHAIQAMKSEQQAKRQVALLLSDSTDEELEGVVDRSYEYRIEEHRVFGEREKVTEPTPKIRAIVECVRDDVSEETASQRGEVAHGN